MCTAHSGVFWSPLDNILSIGTICRISFYFRILKVSWNYHYFTILTFKNGNFIWFNLIIIIIPHLRTNNMRFAVLEQSCEVQRDRDFKFAKEDTEVQREWVTFESLYGDDVADRGLAPRSFQSPSVTFLAPSLHLKGQGPITSLERTKTTQTS